MVKKSPERGSLKLWGYFQKAIDLSKQQEEILQNLITLFCFKLGISEIPVVRRCSLARQNNCIRSMGGVPCGGACYVYSPTNTPQSTIFIRKINSSTYDSLLHELYHHVNRLNDNDAIFRIMNAWHQRSFWVKKGYGRLFKEAGIPMRRRK